jgi:two-component system, NarL family, uhpT operon response regulator UhpA
MTGARLAILEDHALVREALATRLKRAIANATIVYEGSSLTDCKRAIVTTGCDCIILDLDLGDGSPAEFNVAEMVRTDIPVLVVSALASPAIIRTAFSLGVFGYISKSGEPEEITKAVIAALAGETYTSSEAAAAIMSAASTSVALSKQERRAMVLYASGMKMRTVASTMGVTEGTAQEYIKRMRAKYDKAGTPLSTKTDIYRMAVAEGLME